MEPSFVRFEQYQRVTDGQTDKSAVITPTLAYLLCYCEYTKGTKSNKKSVGCDEIPNRTLRTDALTHRTLTLILIPTPIEPQP